MARCNGVRPQWAQFTPMIGGAWQGRKRRPTHSRTDRGKTGGKKEDGRRKKGAWSGGFAVLSGPFSRASFLFAFAYRLGRSGEVARRWPQGGGSPARIPAPGSRYPEADVNYRVQTLPMLTTPPGAASCPSFFRPKIKSGGQTRRNFRHCTRKMFDSRGKTGSTSWSWRLLGNRKKITKKK